MATKYLKEDGSVDVYKIQGLPLKEHAQALCSLTYEQYKEYLSKIPLKESKGVITPIYYNSLEKFLEDTEAVNAWDVINNL